MSCIFLPKILKKGITERGEVDGVKKRGKSKTLNPSLQTKHENP